MFLRNKKPEAPARPAQKKKETSPTVIAHDINILGNIISDGVIDFNGTIDGNIRAGTVTVREQGVVRGEVSADSVFVYGKVKGLIRAKTVYLYGTCHIEGIVMHESLTIEDGAFIDGKCKRTDKPANGLESASDGLDSLDDIADTKVKMLENFRLIQ